MTTAMTATTIAAASASGQDPARPASRMPAVPSAPALASTLASQIPASAPATDTNTDNGIASTAARRVSCARVAPRAVSSAVSASRWAVSSRPTASSAAMARTRSCRALITSSDQATVRSLPAAVRMDGRLVVVCAPFRTLEFGSGSDRAVTLAAIGSRLPAGNAAMSGCATHDPLSIVSAAPNAAWFTISGP